MDLTVSLIGAREVPLWDAAEAGAEDNKRLSASTAAEADNNVVFLLLVICKPP
ncbi:hypothetical protein D3C81_1493030 [compost metagenome]